MSDKSDCRTAQATPGLLTPFVIYTKPWTKSTNIDPPPFSSFFFYKVLELVGRHGKIQFIYTSKVKAKTILPEKVRKLQQK